jgi:hypothetical protein
MSSTGPTDCARGYEPAAKATRVAAPRQPGMANRLKAWQARDCAIGLDRTLNDDLNQHWIHSSLPFAKISSGQIE